MIVAEREERQQMKQALVLLMTGMLYSASASDIRFDGGKLDLNGTVAAETVSVGADAVMQGSGTVDGSGSVAGTIAPGNGSATSVDVLSFTGNLAFEEGGTFECYAASHTNLDKIQVGGTVTGSGDVSLTKAAEAIPLYQVIVDGGASSEYASFDAGPTNWSLSESSAVVTSLAVIAVDSLSTNSNNTGADLVIPHITGSGDHRHMLVGISYEDDNASGMSVTSVLYGAYPLSQVIKRVSTQEAISEIWSLSSPPSGADSIRIGIDEGDANGVSIAAAVVTFTGVSQTAPMGTAAGAIGNSTAASVTVSSASSELIFDNLAVDDGHVCTAGAGQTQRYNLRTETGTDGITCAGSTRTGDVSVTTSWAIGSLDTWALCAVPLKPALITAPAGDLLVSETTGDSDSDTLPDKWEFDNYDDRTAAEQYGDDDDDLMLNWQERVAGTDPWDDASLLTVDAVETRSKTNLVISWQSVDGKLYSVHRRTNLVSGAIETLAQNITATPPVNTFTNAVTEWERFYYRVEVQQ